MTRYTLVRINASTFTANEIHELDVKKTGYGDDDTHVEALSCGMRTKRL